MLPGFPRKISLRLAGDEPPIDRSNVFVLCNGQHCVKRAAHRTRHIFRADHGPVVFLQPRHFTFEIFRPAIVMKGDDVRLA